MAQKSRCINYNLPRIKTLADKLGYSPARTAIEVENWQDTNNKGWAVVPTIEEMGMDFIPWGKNIELYKKYNLITTDNQIKSLSEKEANSWVSTNNQNGAYYFEVKKNEKGKFFISMAKRLWDRTKFDSQLSLFDTVDNNTKLTPEQNKNINDLKSIESFYADYSNEQIQAFIESKIPDSKVKEVVFHGTNKEFDNFDKLFINKSFENLIYFFKNKNNAKEWNEDSFERINKIDLINKLNLLNTSVKEASDEDNLLYAITQHFTVSNKEQFKNKTKETEFNDTLKLISFLNLDINELYKEYLKGIENYRTIVREKIKNSSSVKTINHNRVIAAIINAKNPLLLKDKYDYYLGKESGKKFKKDVNDNIGNKDSLIATEITEYENDKIKNIDTQYGVKEPSQITILNSTETIAEFKEFVNNKSLFDTIDNNTKLTPEQNKNINDLKSIEPAYVDYSNEQIQAFIESKIPDSKVKNKDYFYINSILELKENDFIQEGNTIARIEKIDKTKNEFNFRLINDLDNIETNQYSYYENLFENDKHKIKKGTFKNIKKFKSLLEISKKIYAGNIKRVKNENGKRFIKNYIGNTYSENVILTEYLNSNKVISSVEILEIIEENDKDFKSIANIIKNIIIKNNFEITITTNAKNEKDNNAAGDYIDGHINMYVSNNDNDYSRIIIHELLHAISDNNSFQSQIDSLYKYTQKFLKDNNIDYGLKNNREFLAEIFSNRVFQELMGKIEYSKSNEKKLSILDEFLRLLSSFFKIENNSILEQAFVILEDINKYTNLNIKNKDNELLWSRANLTYPKTIAEFKQFVNNKSLFDTSANTTQDNRNIKLLTENTNAVNYLQQVIESGHPLATVAKAMLSSATATPIRIISDDFLQENRSQYLIDNNLKASAVFFPGKKEIWISDKALQSDGFKYGEIATVLHEIMHSMSYDKLRYQTEASVRFQKLFDYLKENEEKFTDTYPLANIDELMVAIYTNPKFINDLKNIPARSNKYASFYHEIVEFFRMLFKFPTNESSLFEEVFLTAEDVLSSVVQENTNIADEAFFDIAESQLDIYNELIKTNAVKSADEKEYIVNGESGYKRATSLVRKKFNLNNLNTSTSQDLGDIFHAVTANYIANEFAEFNTHYKPVVLEGLDEATILNVHAIIDPIINKAKAEGSVLIVELPVASSKRKVAGTIDLLEITSDKKLRMLDYKTTMFNKNIANTIKTVIGNSDQQVIYKNILKENDEKLGRQSRNVEFQELLRIKATNNNGIKYQVIETVPIIYQASTNKKRNAMLSNLFLQIEELLNKRNMSNAEKTDRVLEAKYKLMIKLQTDASNQEILTEALGDLAAIENIMSQGVDPNLDYSSYRTDLDLYKRLAEYIKPETTAEKALVREIVGQAEILFQELYEGARESFVNKVVEDLKIEGGPIQTADDVLKPVKDINSYQSYALGTSYSENPIVIGIYKQIQERLSVARTKSSILSREVALMVDELKAFTGKTGDSIYDNFLQTLKGKKTGYLVRQFRSEFYEGVTLAKAKGDLKWFSDNSTFDVEKYKLAKQKFQDILTMSRPSSVAKKIVDLRADEKFKDTSDEEILKVADKFVSINNDEALAKWVTDHKSISMYHIPNSNWTDSKWNDIKNGKFKGTVIERFYDKYTSVMEEIENVGLPFYVSENYIPDFKKNFIDRLMSTGVGNLKLGKSLYDSLSLPFDETEINKINPYTGEFIRSIPVLGKKSFATSEERNTFVEQDKSYDLAYSLAVFYESSLRHQELKTVESSIEVAKAVLHNQKEKVVNSVGEGVEGGFDQSKLAQGLKNEIERLEYFINATVYGKTNNKEVGIAITGNAFTNKIGFLNKGEAGVLSLDKLLNTILKYTGLNNIGYNMYAPVTNILGGKSMQWLMGVGGRWYNAKDYNFATAVVTAGPFSKASEDIVKANLFVQMLDPQINEFIQKEFELTKSDPKILHKVPGPFYAMQWSEDHMQKSGLIAMIKSDKHSVKWSDYKVVNDKLVFVGAVELEEGVVEAFRQKVIHVNGRALGNMNPDDKIRLKGHFLGRAIIQHRGWIPAILQSHWSNRKYDYQLQEYVEGRFNSLSTFIFKKSLTWTKLDEVERANVREALAEISIIIASMMLIALIKAGDTDDDKKRRKQLAFFIRVLDRYHAEITFFTPFEISGKAQILISPAPAVSSIKNVGTFLTNSWQMLWGEPEEAEKAQKKFTKSSIRLLPLYSQGERFINEALYQDINSSK